MFVLPAEIEERRHEEGYESANMSRPNLFKVLMKLNDSELTVNYTVFYMVEIKLYAWENQTFQTFFFLIVVGFIVNNGIVVS